MNIVNSARDEDASRTFHDLSVLRKLLRRDYLTRADLQYALADLARMAQEALEAREALVALWDPATESWSAGTSVGDRLGDEEISAFGSRSVLDSVRTSGEPLLTGRDAPLELQSKSLTSHGVGHVLAVPLWFWDVRDPRPEREFGGCLYADRALLRESFTTRDVELVLDICRLAEPNLNLLRHLTEVESRLQASCEELEELRQTVSTRFCLGEFKTADPWFAENVLLPLRRVCHAEKVGILFLGPTGSGKTFLARSYHYASSRRDGAFITLDCAQVTSAETLAAELFGYAPRSGYANAPLEGRPGKAELADQGTLFIDEVASLPLALQQQLLRLIEEGRFSRLGRGASDSVDIQILAASNADLPRLIEEGRFREDLYWRLKEMTIYLPPLNRRPADIPHLAQSLLDQARNRFGRRKIESFSPTALSALLHHDWSRNGNIRGLQHTVHRSVLLAPSGTRILDVNQIEFEEVFSYGRHSESERSAARDPAPLESGREAQRPGQRSDAPIALLEAKIVEHQGKVATMSLDPEVAQVLGYNKGRIPASTLSGRLKKLGLLEQLERERGRQRLGLSAIVSAIEKQGTGTAAAHLLGITRDALSWRLRQAGLTIRQIRRGDYDPALLRRG